MRWHCLKSLGAACCLLAGPGVAAESDSKEGLRYEENCVLYRGHLTVQPDGALEYSWTHVEPKVHREDEEVAYEPIYENSRDTVDPKLWARIAEIVFDKAGVGVRKREGAGAFHHPCNVIMSIRVGGKLVSYEMQEIGGFYENTDEAGRAIARLLYEVKQELEREE